MSAENNASEELVDIELDFTDEEFARITAAAEARGMTVNDYIVNALKRLMEK